MDQPPGNGDQDDFGVTGEPLEAGPGLLGWRPSTLHRRSLGSEPTLNKE